MRRTTVITATLLALSLAPALQAQRWGDRHDDHSRNQDRYRDQDRYRYPNSGQMERVAALAHEIDDAATYIHREAERNNRRPDRNEARMLADLHRLNEQADRFHRRVESDRQNPRNTADEFAALEDAFNRLTDTLRYNDRRSYINRGMGRIYGAMNELARFYGRGSYGRWGDGRSGQDRYDGRYGRDRDDRHGRDDRDDHDGYRPPYN